MSCNNGQELASTKIMAEIIPSLNSCLSRMTRGEKRLAELFKSHLEDDYLIWYDVPVGEKPRYPDFILVHPHRGILVLEVKDWMIETICEDQESQPDHQFFTLLKEGRKVKESNPLRQARDYALLINKLLCRDIDLVHNHGDYQGKLVCPYGYGVVFTNIDRMTFESAGLGGVVSSGLVICKDEMQKGVDPLVFQQQLWDMFSYKFSQSLSSLQIDKVRFHIFPGIRMPSKRLSTLLDNSQINSLDFEQPDFSEQLAKISIEPVKIPEDLLKVMDLRQEKLARSLGDGHRVIHGVAGSGKTMILLYRSRYLAEQQPAKPILVLCFNVVLARKLQEMIEQSQGQNIIQVVSFHKWLNEQLAMAQLPSPNHSSYENDQEYFAALEQQVINGIAANKIATGQYSSVLIDEGHDMKPQWLQLLSQMPEDNSLLLLYDDAQNLYLQERKQKKRSFKSMGIQAQGRTQILNINYRNTTEVLTLAYEFAQEFIRPTEGDDEDAPILLKPETAGRHGELPQIVSRNNFAAEVRYLSDLVRKMHQQGIPWNDMVVLYRMKFMAETVEQNFKAQDIPIDWLNKNRDARHLSPQAQTIKLITLHSSKGLEFPVVIIPGLGYSSQQAEVSDEARLLYVAMTRSTNHLIMTYHQESDFVRRLQLLLPTTNRGNHNIEIESTEKLSVAKPILKKRAVSD